MKSMSLKAKLMSLGIFGAVVTGIVGVVGVMGMGKMAEPYREISEVNMVNSNAGNEMLSEFRKARIFINRMLFPDISAEEMVENRKKIQEAIAAYEASEKKLIKEDWESAQKERYAKIQVGWKNFKEDVDQFFAVSDQSDAKGDRAAKMADFLRKEVFPNMDPLAQSMDHFAQAEVAQAEELSKQAMATEQKVEWFIIWTVALGSIVALAIGYWTATKVSRTISETADQLASGSNQVAAASQQIAGASSELSASVTEQAAAVQQTVASVDEVSAMVSKNADNAKRSQEGATNCSSVAERGKQAVDEMIQSIAEINQSNQNIMEQIESSNAQIGDIVKVINEIGSKTKVINDIVFQTKLLSFNASVEAARAGENGKGFAVVAEEVGNLAQMSGNAAKEISQLLEGSIQRVEQIVSSTRGTVEKMMVASKAKVDAGTVTAQRCGEVLDQIVKNVNDVNHMVNEISTASKEQAQGVSEINKAMNQLDQSSQMNSSATQEVAGVAEGLRTQAQDMTRAVEFLQALVRGGEQVPAPITGTAKHTASNVVNLPKAKKEVRKAAPEMKVAVGQNLPSRDDSRFEEV